MKYYITTPIYYINDKPHIGHAYSTIIADIFAHYHRLKGDETLFSCGVDENAQKTVEAAKVYGKDVVTYTNEMSDHWEQTWKKLNITNDDFIRTTAERHKKAVHECIARVTAKGDIYKGSYEGFYCVGCESFKKESDLVDGLCFDHKKKPEWLTEENYFFSLSKYQDTLLEHITAHPEFIEPASRRNEVLAFIKSGLQDFSVSRETQKWGIPWPGDEKHVVYVWFDALVNYLTVAGFPDSDYEKFWPADVHIVGKEIIKFHCVYWPAMLMSAGLPLPNKIYAHGWLTINGEKMSKSLGNAIDPVALAERFGNDTLRYFLLREVPFGNDGDFSFERVEERYSADLAKGLGNFVSRVLALANKLELDHLNADDEKFSQEAKKLVANTWEAWHKGFDTFSPDITLDAIWKLITWGDHCMEETKPWSLIKEDQEKCTKVLGTLTEVVRHLSLLVSPVMPQTSEKIGQSLGISKHDTRNLEESQQWRAMPFRSIIKGEALFPLHSNAKE